MQNWVALGEGGGGVGGEITKCIMDSVKMVNFLDPLSQ